MKRHVLATAIAMMAISVTFVGCKMFHDIFQETYHCTVNTVGNQDVGKKFFVETNFPEDINKLVTREYRKDLEKVMENLGYKDVDDDEADIRVVYSFNLGEVVVRDYMKTVTTSEWQPGTKTTTKTDLKSKSNERGKDSSENTQMVTTQTTEGKYVNKEKLVNVHEEKQAVTVTIEAYDTKDNELIWATTITDNPDVAITKNLRKYMPIYLLNAMPHLGRDTKGDLDCSIYMDDERLKWF